MNTLFRTNRIRRIINDLHGLIISDIQSIRLSRLCGYYANPQDAACDMATAEPFLDDQIWGGRHTYSWFHGVFTLPDDYEGKSIELLIATADEEKKDAALLYASAKTTQSQWDLMNPQFMLFIDGKLMQGLDVHHRSAVLPCIPNQQITIDLQAFAGMTDRRYALHVAYGTVHADVRGIYYDLLTALEAAETLEDYDTNRDELLNSLNEACSILDIRNPYSEAFFKSISKAREYLMGTVYNGADDRVTAICVGHTHIDIAWLWDHTQTRLKSQRSFSSILRLMERYPDFTFFHSSPLLFQWLKHDNSVMYEQIKQYVSQGRFEMGGAMWLEADCNIPSGESLIRQIVYGKRFLRKEFNVESEVLWLPDVFGYSAALPQILIKSGVKTFVTSKISWNTINKFPYDTFLWQGIDGTQVLTYFITTTEAKKEDGGFGTTYNGILNPASVMGSWKRYQQKEINDNVLVAYGYGDGGGGPDECMLEKGIRMQRGILGFPTVKMGHIQPFFQALHQKVDAAKYLPKWVGELYLELHQGAYTSMAMMKRNNRMAERELSFAELVQSAWMLHGGTYSSEKLHDAWELLLLNQFHDTLPGSCIGKVYEDAKDQFSKIFSYTNECIHEAIYDMFGQGEQLLVCNDCSFARQDLLLLPENQVISGQPYQETSDGNLCWTPEIPAMGWLSAKSENAKKYTPTSTQDDCLNTQYFSIEINQAGEICRLYDKLHNRELVTSQHYANVFQAFDDRPYKWDTWNIDLYYEEKQYNVNECVEIGPKISGTIFENITVKKSFNRSVIRQEIRTYHNLPRIDFITQVDWFEDATVLKVAFPVNLNADFATFDTQCGMVRRPTHRNTSWDQARYEVCAHRWADISEGDFGVSLLNDCKYGFDVCDRVMRLTLLKAGMSPDETIDRGEHRFTYSLFTHSGACGAETHEMAARLNQPLRMFWTKKAQPAASLLTIDNHNITIDAIKQDENGEGMLVIRMHEQGNTHACANLMLGFDVACVSECDLMEENRQYLDCSHGKIILHFKPFEIKTLILCL